MSWMAALCGVLIVLLGFWSTGSHHPTEGQSVIQITCFVGGLIICFLAVVLARLTTVLTRLDTLAVGLGMPPREPDQDDGVP